MKNRRQTKKIGEEKEPIVPNWEESTFAKTIDGQIMLMLKKAIIDKHFIEAHVLSWSTIEQILLPRLIGWIGKTLKINMPEEIYRANAQNINFIYLCISQDEDLYRKLEEGRKKRNKILHQLSSLDNAEAISKIAKECTEENLLLQKDIMKRFNGVVLVPSINLYKNGWNDALNRAIKDIKNEK